MWRNPGLVCKISKYFIVIRLTGLCQSTWANMAPWSFYLHKMWRALWTRTGEGKHKISFCILIFNICLFVLLILKLFLKGFHELESPRNGRPYCRNCYIDLTCSKCVGCTKPITDKAVKALDSDWHVDCFVCKVSEELY